MIRRLRLKFIMTAFLAVLAVLVVLVGGINVSNYVNVVRDSDKVLGMLADNDGRFPDRMTRPGNEDPAQEHYGLIAQDVKMVMDRLKIAKDAFGGYVDGETLGLRYDEFIAPLILTVQRQQEEIDELKRLIKEGK